MTDWPLRRWIVAVVTALATIVVIGFTTAMIPSPFLARRIPAPSWTWPVLVVTAVLSGLVTATYVARPGEEVPRESMSRGGVLGGYLAWVAVGCPSCNKIVLLALGSTGAVRWFAPVQPVLAVAGIVALGYALRRRLAGERACPVPVSRA